MVEPSAGEFAELAVAMHREPTVEETVERVLEFAHQAVDCTQAGILFVHTGRRIETVRATDPAVAALDALQMELGRGPDLDLVEDGHDVVVDDTHLECRWPEWAAAVAGAGLRSMLGVRLAQSAGFRATLNLYAEQPRHFSESDRQVAHVLARHAAIALASAHNEEHLRRAMDSRKLIGQAQGILMVTFDLDADRAFEVLRRYSQHHNMKLHDVAQWVVDHRRLPAFSDHLLGSVSRSAEQSPGA